MSSRLDAILPGGFQQGHDAYGRTHAFVKERGHWLAQPWTSLLEDYVRGELHIHCSIGIRTRQGRSAYLLAILQSALEDKITGIEMMDVVTSGTSDVKLTDVVYASHSWNESMLILIPKFLQNKEMMPRHGLGSVIRLESLDKVLQRWLDAADVVPPTSVRGIALLCSFFKEGTVVKDGELGAVEGTPAKVARQLIDRLIEGGSDVVHDIAKYQSPVLDQIRVGYRLGKAEAKYVLSRVSILLRDNRIGFNLLEPFDEVRDPRVQYVQVSLCPSQLCLGSRQISHGS